MAASYQQLKDILGFNFEASSNTNAPIRSVVIIGENLDVDTGTVPETIWEIGGEYSFPTAATVATVVSSSANDTSAGSGARIVFLEGLDANWNQVSDIITLNGTSNVLGTTSFFRVNNARVISSGSGMTNAGTITITVNAKTVRNITIGESLDHTAVYSVPAKHHLFIVSQSYSTNRSATPGYATIATNVFVSSTNTKYQSTTITVDGSQVFIQNHDFALPRINEKTDIWYNIEFVSASNTQLSSTVRGLLAHESWIPRWTR